MNENNNLDVLNGTGQKIGEITADLTNKEIPVMTVLDVIKNAVENPEEFSSIDLDEMVDAWKIYKREQKAKKKALKKLRKIVNREFSTSWITSLKIFWKKLGEVKWSYFGKKRRGK